MLKRGMRALDITTHDICPRGTTLITKAGTTTLLSYTVLTRKVSMRVCYSRTAVVDGREPQTLETVTRTLTPQNSHFRPLKTLFLAISISLSRVP